MLGVARNRYRGDGPGYSWPHSPSGVGLIRDVLGHRTFNAHSSGVDFHRGIDVVRGQGDPNYSPLSGAVIRSHFTFFWWETPYQLTRWTKVDPSSSLTVSHGGSNLVLTCARVGAASFPSGVARYIPTVERITPHGTDDWLVQLALTSAISVTGAIGIGVFSPDLSQYIAVEYDGATFTRRGVGTATFTGNGATTAVAGQSWLRVTYTISTDTYAWWYSANGTSWTSLGSETGRNFTSQQQTFAPTLYWRSGDTNATPYAIGVKRTEWYDLGENTASRFGNHLHVANATSKFVLHHFQELHVERGAFVSTGQKLGLAGITGFDDRSGAVLQPHVHVEYHSNSRFTYSGDESINPLDSDVLPRANVSNNVVATVTRTNDPNGNDSHRLRLVTTRADQDFDVNTITLTGNVGTRTVNCNSRTGLDPADADANNYNGVYFSPVAFDENSGAQEVSFYFAVATVGGTVVSYQVLDTQGRTLASG
jgi:hypothetical protein